METTQNEVLGALRALGRATARQVAEFLAAERVRVVALLLCLENAHLARVDDTGCDVFWEAA